MLRPIGICRSWKGLVYHKPNSIILLCLDRCDSARKRPSEERICLLKKRQELIRLMKGGGRLGHQLGDPSKSVQTPLQRDKTPLPPTISMQTAHSTKMTSFNFSKCSLPTLYWLYPYTHICFLPSIMMSVSTDHIMPLMESKRQQI